jgi:catechol-2,3-dioxygenase
MFTSRWPISIARSLSIRTCSASLSFCDCPTTARRFAAGAYHHHIALNTWLSRGSRLRLSGTPAYHLAIRYPDRRSLASAVERLLEAGIRRHGVADHGVSESIYLADPDSNGVELTCDRPFDRWPRRADGTLDMTMADRSIWTRVLREARSD